MVMATKRAVAMAKRVAVEDVGDGEGGKSDGDGANVGRRGTNQLRLLERYLDVLVKHTTEIPPPTALVEVRPRLP
jgi:hypothetical protein